MSSSEAAADVMFDPPTRPVEEPTPMPVDLAPQLRMFDVPPVWRQTPGGFPQRGMAGPHLPVSLSDEWLTPPALLRLLGDFDLDPCACRTQPWPTAARHFTVDDNGFAQRWEGRVWLNPPYGRATSLWLGRLAEHGDGIALIFARTETAMFFEHVWPKADGILFLRGRLTFYRPDGTPGDFNGGAPSCLVAYGEGNARRLAGLGSDVGQFVSLRG